MYADSWAGYIGQLIGQLISDGISENKQKEQQQEREQKNKILNDIINTFTPLELKLKEARECIIDAKEKFIQGGHVFEGQYPAKEEFNSYIGEINNALIWTRKIIDACTEQLN